MTLRIISGAFKGRILKTPKGSITRPTQGMLREAVFNICQHEIKGSRFLDFFAGSGSMGMEAISRGAAHSTFVEQNRRAASCIQENIQALQIQEQTALLITSAERAIESFIKNSAQFDLIYIDPPYDRLIDLNFLAPFLAPHGILFLEERHEPKKTKKSHQTTLCHKDTRRFGIASLSIYLKQDD